MTHWKQLLTVAVSATLFLQLSAADEPQILAEDDFEAGGVRSQWDGGEVVGGALYVEVQGDAKKFIGTRALLQPELKIPQDGVHALHVNFKILSFENAESEGPLEASARIFLAPEPLPKFTEPYVMPHTLTMYVNYDTYKGLTFTLYRKNKDKGFGKIIYSGTLEAEQLPLEVDLFVTKDYYRVLFDKDVLSDKGSLSGYNELPMDVWSAPVRFGIRSVNQIDGVRARIGFDDFKFEIKEGLRK